MNPDPDITEEPYICQHCKQAVGMMVAQHGRVIGLRLPTITGGWLMARSVHGVCECCGSPFVFAVSDTVLRQVLLELQAAGLV